MIDWSDVYSLRNAMAEVLHDLDQVDPQQAQQARQRYELSTLLLERAIGVIYRPLTELQSHYFQAVLADQFDAFIWLDETHPVKPLGAPGSASHDDETYPFGI
ncbi:Erythromycin esterase [compost metagenome]